MISRGYAKCASNDIGLLIELGFNYFNYMCVYTRYIRVIPQRILHPEEFRANGARAVIASFVREDRRCFCIF